MDSLDLDKLTERPIEMSYASIASATSSFVNRLGKGGFGEVYMGLDVSGKQFAVKVLRSTSEQTKKLFLNEVATIGRIHHVHVVRLLGFCTEDHHRILVYEYVNNGSLDKWLFYKRSTGGDPERFLHWEQRFDIALGVARGLCYLHDECRHRIVHCDIKPQNILLDEHLCPKIADFGLAKLMDRHESGVVTKVRGTPGYMAPESWMGGDNDVTTKFDVYSYGMLLLELISGHQNFEKGACFPEAAFEAAVQGDLGSIIDERLGMMSSSCVPYLPAEDEPSTVFASNTCMLMKHVRTALFVALWCIQDNPMCRPHMSEVVQYLQGSLAISEEPPRPTVASILMVSLHRPLAMYNNESYDRYSQSYQQQASTPVSGR